MNYAILFKLQGFIMGAIAFAFALSLGIAMVYDTHSTHELAVTGFGVSFLVAACLSGGFLLLGRTGDNTLFRKEALATIGTGWLLASLVGAIPYFLILPDVSFSGAFFESASGLTTTGASVLSDLETLPRSLHFWRAISQWMGGLGVVVFFVAVLSFLGAGAKVLYSRESSAQAADLNTSRVQDGVLHLLYLYFGLSVICTVVYWICGLGWFEAIIHMFTTLSTGGFSTRSGSIADFANPALEWAIIVFMAIGGTSFLLIIELLRRNWKALKTSTEFKAYVVLILSFSLLIFIFLVTHSGDNPDSHGLIRAATFQVISIMTTTGFATVDFDLWLPVTHILLLALMFIGGCSGSTAGGTKVIRFIVALKVSGQHIEKAYRSRVVRALKVNGKSLSLGEQESIVVYVVILSLIVFSGTVIVSFLEPNMSFEGIVSAMAACLFNIGPGFAEVGPSHNFAGLHAYSQIFLSFLMIMGRLELFALLVLFSPSLWKRF
ncbi:TrkH family potassium uptake protein [Puniceicoccales bacterium CK1056]|uniref:TrkH family potassium uptake protein n=1 Tax=Oceanipulchritudo coccoides TaxID=2706888 RepID=A0A6B2M380_9BACT|nr:TrkH family potassium uptake protein [Oceanipulchritudo coccoides]NDV62554.1 TrkH family potassium uptake protein [Oceanipulchritudo coccoides]